MAALLSSTGASSSQWKYHVFLSFRGDDTRKSFTDHLYAALQRKGIMTFKDDEELEKGQVISGRLMKAIEESLFMIVVLSPDYASSSWCLDELQKIVESRQNLGRTVFPIFYGVDPSDVRHQKGNIATAFRKHEEKFIQDKQKLQKWRDALSNIANLAGWDTRDKHEAGIIEEIVAAIWTKLQVKLPCNFGHLVGIESKVDTLISHLKIGLDHTCFMGIWGMGGIGKTTLARVVFEAIQNKFEISCFLANVREDSEKYGLVDLQKKLLSCLHLRGIEINDSHGGVKAIRQFLCNKTALIVLDDVSHKRQLENLAGNKDWFGAGSRIIVTTRDIHLLTEHEQFEKYNIKMLNRDESLKLFCQRAFKRHDPPEGYAELSRKVVEYASGLPLAVQVLGSFLCGRNPSEWWDTLDKLKQNLSKDIYETLRISYDGLEDAEYKTIFLDIACFFNGKQKSEVTKILENCGLHPTIGINVLIEKSLLDCTSSKDGKQFLFMHDLLQEMGKNIILQESQNDVDKRSRLWSTKEIDLVLTRYDGTTMVQSIVLNVKEPYKVEWHRNCFSRMNNLRLLNLRNVHLSGRLNSLSSTLKVVIWEGFPLKSLPRNVDRLNDLVELTLCHSKIRRLWNGIPILSKLKFIDLSYSQNLIETPDFSGVPNLETLSLESCMKLAKIHESLGQLKKLLKLNLGKCKSLVTVPLINLEMNSSQRGLKLEKDVGSIENNNQVSGPSIRKASFFRHGLSKIPFLVGRKLCDCFSGLSSLRELNLSFCYLCNESITDGLSCLSSLVKLDISSNRFTSLPVGCVSELVHLEYFDLNGCQDLESIPQLPPNIIVLNASRCVKSMRSLEEEPDLFASLLSKHRNVFSREDDVTLLHINGNRIPTWFEEPKLSSGSDRFVEKYVHGVLGACISVVEDIPDYIGDKSEWLRIAVCIGVENHSRSKCFKFSWSFRTLGVEPFFKGEREFYFGQEEFSSRTKLIEQMVECHFNHLYILIFPFSTHNRLQHFGDQRRQLHLQIELHRPLGCREYGWRLM